MSQTVERWNEIRQDRRFPGGEISITAAQQTGQRQVKEWHQWNMLGLQCNMWVLWYSNHPRGPAYLALLTPWVFCCHVRRAPSCTGSPCSTVQENKSVLAKEHISVRQRNVSNFLQPQANLCDDECRDEPPLLDTSFVTLASVCNTLLPEYVQISCCISLHNSLSNTGNGGRESTVYLSQPRRIKPP